MLFNMQREDKGHFPKYGTTLRGGCFLNGERTPHNDGESHAQPLPDGPLPDKFGDKGSGEDGGSSWELVKRPLALDENSAAADFPEMENSTENTGDCGGQFQGKVTVDRITRAAL